MSRRSTCRCRKLDRVFEAHAVQGDPDFTPPSLPPLSLSLSCARSTVSPCRVGKLLRMKTPMPPSSACHDPPITYKPRTDIGVEFIPPPLLPCNWNVELIEFRTIFYLLSPGMCTSSLVPPLLVCNVLSASFWNTDEEVFYHFLARGCPPGTNKLNCFCYVQVIFIYRE